MRCVRLCSPQTCRSLAVRSSDALHQCPGRRSDSGGNQRYWESLHCAPLNPFVAVAPRARGAPPLFCPSRPAVAPLSVLVAMGTRAGASLRKCGLRRSANGDDQACDAKSREIAPGTSRPWPSHNPARVPGLFLFRHLAAPVSGGCCRVPAAIRRLPAPSAPRRRLCAPRRGREGAPDRPGPF